MLLFFLAYLLIYGGLNVYVYYTILSGLGVHSAPIAFLLVVLVLVPIFLRFAEAKAPRWLAILLAWVGFNWMGVAFLFASVSLLADGIQVFASGFSQQDALWWVIGLTLILSGYGFWESRRIRIRYLSVRSPKLDHADGKPFRLVQISDVHLGYGTLPGQVKGIVKRVGALNPDLLVSTGDLFDTDLKHLGAYVNRLKTLRPAFGKFAVIGNHEVYAGLEEAIKLTEASGFNLLRADSQRVADNLYVAGVDDPEVPSGLSAESLEAKAFEKIPEGAFVVLLKHRPQVTHSQLGKFDLQLSGHTHGGQIFPFIFLTRLQYRARHGLTQFAEATYLYLSRGTGSWVPQLRVFAPPEITVFDLSNGEQFEISVLQKCSWLSTR